jgi:hypothetical protein
LVKRKLVVKSCHFWDQGVTRICKAVITYLFADCTNVIPQKGLPICRVIKKWGEKKIVFKFEKVSPTFERKIMDEN